MSNTDTMKKAKKVLDKRNDLWKTPINERGKTYSYRGHSEQAELDTGLLIRPQDYVAE